MIPKSCKRLAEVDFPIAVVSKHSVEEKSIRQGLPSTLHLWWARRPLAACRAMLLALILPDPGDPNCPAEFKKKARALLPGVQGEPGPKDIDLQKALLRFIGDFANWDLASNSRYLEVGRGLVKAAHGDETPLVVDPFAGGGSIPLEALRLGCDAFASDLNPVACLILQTMLEDIPRHGPELVDEFRRVGADVKKQTEKDLAQYFPPDPDGARPIAYLWARTVKCESPNCGAEIPLTRSFWLCNKPSRLRALRATVLNQKDKTPEIELEVITPKTEKEVRVGTVTRAKATCLACDRVLAPDRVRAQLREQRGGADAILDANGRRIGGARLLSVVTLAENAAGRKYRVASKRDYEAIWKAQKAVAKLTNETFPGGLKIVPDEPLPPQGTLGFRVQLYGMSQWGDLFSVRQKLAFLILTRAVRQLDHERSMSGVAQPLAMLCSKLADRCNSVVNWSLGVECPNQLFKGTALPMGWDFCESNILSDSSGSIEQSIESICRSLASLCIPGTRPATVHLSDACEAVIPDESSSVWFTDPPYYDAVPYADLSDFFFVWLKRALPNHPLLRDPFDKTNALTPKEREIVQDEVKLANGGPKDKAFFEDRMALAFTAGRNALKDDGIGSVVFAHKTTEGWEALLTGIIRGGWTVTASWPIATERYSRFRARESAALATSVHLVCRPRAEGAEIGDWGDVLRELPNRIGDWMERLSAEGVRGADLVFACIGPAMEVYSRYSKVEDAEGRPIPLGGDPEASEPHKRGFLAYVWEIVGRTALGQVLGTAEARARNGAAGALEEDARLTALFLWTLQSTAVETDSGNGSENGEDADDEDDGTTGKKKGLSLIYDVVRRFSQPLGIHLENWNDRIISTEKGIVRLLPITERAEHLLGEDGATGVADVIERTRGGPINYKFAFAEDAVKKTAPATDGKGRKRRTAKSSDEAPTMQPGTTTLDRVHIAMLLQFAGKSNALRTMLKAETDRAPDFLRLANALSALYPKDSEEKRLLDAMLLAVPR